MDDRLRQEIARMFAVPPEFVTPALVERFGLTVSTLNVLGHLPEDVQMSVAMSVWLGFMLTHSDAETIEDRAWWETACRPRLEMLLMAFHTVLVSPSPREALPKMQQTLNDFIVAMRAERARES